MMTIEELQRKEQWLLWKKEWDEKQGRFDKVPYATSFSATGERRRASSNDPTTWDYYTNALEISAGHDDMGVGLALTRGIAVIDIDCHNPEWEKNPLQDELLELFADTYCERSPSGKGIHILFCVDFDKLPVVERTDGKGSRIDNTLFYVKNSKADIECYVGGATYRYMTFTGDMVSNVPMLTDCTRKFIYFLYKYMRKNNDDIETILEKARKNRKSGNKFKKLFDDGDKSDYGNDDSGADMALADLLAFWFGKNEDDMKTALYKSALDRTFTGDKKWSQHDSYMHDYLIAPAIRDCTEVYKGAGRPRRESGDGESESREMFTIEIMEQEFAELGITLKTNDITNDVEIYGSDCDLDKLTTEMYSELRLKYRGVSKANTFDFAAYIAAKNSYNPVLDMLNENKWDGKDHLNELYKALGIEDDELSMTLVFKWIWQGHILLRNTRKNPVSAEGILVFTGQQGKGKTTFFRQIAVKPEFSDTGLTINTRDKDDQRRVVTTWIAELGELDATFKRADVGYLKSFITRDVDRYRLAYGRCDTVNPRRTNLGATVNETDFLVDQTGNRRYWTIPADNMSLELIKKLDALQIWLQVWEQYAKEDYEKGLATGTTYRHGFRLDKDEFDQLAERNDGYRYKPDWEVELDDIFEEAEMYKYPVREMSTKAFKEEYGIKLSSQKINKYLKAKGYVSRVLDGYDIYKLPSRRELANEFKNNRIRKSK